MKKILLLFLLIVNTALGQITITGSSDPLVNTSYTLCNTGTFNPTYCMTPSFLQDAGTNRYATTYGPPTSNDILSITRRNGHWVIELLYGGGAAWKILYRSALPSNSINPPCECVWEVWDGICFSYGNNVAYTGSNTNDIFLAGTNCEIATPITASTILPNVIHLPQQTTAQIAAISTPTFGMITFDINQKCIKFYNGQEWTCIYNGLGQINSNGDIQLADFGDVIFGNTGAGIGESIVGNYAPTNNGIKLYTSNTTRLHIDNNGNLKVNPNFTLAKSTFEVNGSQGIKTDVFTGNFTLDETMHSIFYTGTGNHTCTLPSPNQLLGREYYINNHSGGGLLFSSNIKTGLNTTTNTSVPGVTLHIVSDGTDWRLIN